MPVIRVNIRLNLTWWFPCLRGAVWCGVQTKTNVEAPVGMLIPLLRDQFAALADKPYIMTRAYSSATSESRSPSSFVPPPRPFLICIWVGRGTREEGWGGLVFC